MFKHTAQCFSHKHGFLASDGGNVHPLPVKAPEIGGDGAIAAILLLCLALAVILGRKKVPKPTSIVNEYSGIEEMVCPRVLNRIECPECGYPGSEARYLLSEVNDPGHRS